MALMDNRTSAVYPIGFLLLQGQTHLHQGGHRLHTKMAIPTTGGSICVSFPLKESQTFDPVSVFMTWIQSGLVADPEPQTSTDEKTFGFVTAAFFPEVPDRKGKSSKLSLPLWRGDIWTPGCTWIPCILGCPALCVFHQCSIPCLAGVCYVSWPLSLVQTPYLLLQWFSCSAAFIKSPPKVPSVQSLLGTPHTAMCGSKVCIER